MEKKKFKHELVEALMGCQMTLLIFGCISMFLKRRDNKTENMDTSENLQDKF